MFGYLAGYRERRTEIYAPNLWAAKVKALEHFKPTKRKASLVWVELAETDGKPVTHVADI